jgi:hypothetical protein
MDTRGQVGPPIGDHPLSPRVWLTSVLDSGCTSMPLSHAPLGKYTMTPAWSGA